MRELIFSVDSFLRECPSNMEKECEQLAELRSLSVLINSIPFAKGILFGGPGNAPVYCVLPQCEALC